MLFDSLQLRSTALSNRVVKGFAILSAKDSKEAFLNALRDQDLVITGDFVEVMWFQGLTDYLQPKANSASQLRHAAP